MSLRSRLLAGTVSFDAEITADYGDELYTFSMHCQSDLQGQVTFTVTQPENISGITSDTIIYNDAEYLFCKSSTRDWNRRF